MLKTNGLKQLASRVVWVSLSLILMMTAMLIILPSIATAVYASGDLSGTYIIQPRGSQLVLDVSNGSRANGARVLLWPRHSGTNQHFRFQRQANGSYHIQAVHSGLLIEIHSASRQPNAQIIQWQDNRNNSLHQQWFVRSVGGGYVEFVNANGSNMAIDIPFGRAHAGAYLQSYRRHGGSNQQFRLIPVSGQSNNNSSQAFQARVTAQSGLNIRAASNNTARIVGAIPFNATVTVTSTVANGAWGRVNFNGVSGYIALQHTQRVTGGTSATNYSNMNRQQLATEILNRHNAGRLSLNSTGTPTSASPLNGIHAAANGNAVPTGIGGTTHLNENMLRAILTLSDSFHITVTSITGGVRQNRNSSHYSGQAFDIGPVNGHLTRSNHNFRVQMTNLMRNIGLTVFESLGPDNCRNHWDHLHFAVR